MNTSSAPRPGAAAEPPASRLRFTRIVPVAFITYSLAYLDRVNYGFGAAAGLATTLGITEATSALISAVFFAGYFLFQIPGASYASRRSAKRLVFWALILWGIFSALTGVITSIPLLLLDRFLLGAVEGVVMPAMLVWLTHWFTKRERSRANTLLILGNPVTLLWASIVTGYLIQAVGWQMMFVLEGIPSIIWAFVWWHLADDRPAAAGWITPETAAGIERALDQEQQGLPPVKNYWAALRDGRVWLLGLQLFCWSLGLYGFVLWLPKIVKEGLNQGIGATGLLTALPYLVGVILMLGASHFSDKLQNRRLFVWPFLFIGAAAFYASYLIGPTNFWLAFACLVVAGGCIFAGYGPFFAIVPEMIPRQAAGEAMALVNSLGALGGFVGTFIVGWLNSVTGGPGASFLFLAASLAGAGVCMLLLSPAARLKPAAAALVLLALISGCAGVPCQTGPERLAVYAPSVKFADIYFPHPGKQPILKYNHDVDIVKFKGRFFAAWNANATPAEGVPGQYNYLSVSDDFEQWSAPVRLFYKEGGCENPVETDNQWQPDFLNYKDETLFCAWCDFNARRTFIATSSDGLRWRNREVPTAPAALAGKVVGFPTNHGLLTRKGVLMFPCSLTPAQKQFSVGNTLYAGVLLSADGGQSWQWSEPIEALPWSKIGEKPEEFGGESVALWEPMLFEQADGSIGLLIRNSTAQEAPERLEKPHRMLLYAVSKDGGHTWTKARTVELDTICSRNYAVGGATSPDSLFMVMNDNHVRVPERISHDRFFLSLFCAPVCDPDLLLPGPLVQPQGGSAFYPNGFVDGGKLYIAYTYPNEIHSSVITPLPDFSKPFLLPREGRPGLRLERDMAYFGQRQSSLGLVLTEALTRAPKVRLAFDLNVNRYQGGDWPVLSLGGKVKQGSSIRAVYSEERKADLFQVATGGGRWADLATFKMKTWNHFEVELTQTNFSVRVNNEPPQVVEKALLRKICFGGLYVAPPWPLGITRDSDIRLRLDTLVIEGK